MPLNISTFGGEIDAVIEMIYLIVLVWLIAAEGVLFYFLFRYKKNGGRAKWAPADTLRANAWILFPVVLVTICDFVIEAASATAWDEVKTELPESDFLVRIEGRQFVWRFVYAGEDGVLDTADDFQTVNELRIPRGEVIRFELVAHDVLHSFWVPALRLKQDAVPGRVIPGWFAATTDGLYDIACAEICGAGHTMMRADLVVEPPEVYQAWAKAAAEQAALYPPPNHVEVVP